MPRTKALVLVALALTGSAAAQTTPAPTAAGATARPPASDTGKAILSLSAALGSDPQPLRTGISWRIFNESAEADGTHALVAESKEAMPVIALPEGQYIVHAAYGLAGAPRRVVMADKPVTERLSLNAGGLRLIGVIGETPLPTSRETLSIYVPERGNSEAKLVAANVKPGETIILPEGTYHVVSTYLDNGSVRSFAPAAPGSTTSSNSIVAADLRVQTGKLTETTLRHRAATQVLKLVNAPGGEAMANTSFTVLTPGGDVIRELIGAFPSLVLAEGEYVVIARHDAKTYQTTFKVESSLDRDVEIIAK